MRWGVKPALVGANRDEDVLHQPKAPPPVLKRAGPKPTLTGTAFGRTMRPGKSALVVSSSALNFDDAAAPASGGSAQTQQQLLLLPPSSLFLVCAGRGVSSNNAEHTDDSGDGVLDVSSVPDCDIRHSAASDVSDPVRRSATGAPLQRSDSELELIISELREKIALQHRLEDGRHRVAAGGALDSSRGSASWSAEYHARKHFKNPVERMNGNQEAASSLSSSNSSAPARRQPMTNVSRPQTAGHAPRLPPPEVVATSITSAFTSSSSSTSSLSCVSLLASGGGAASGGSLPAGCSTSHTHDVDRSRVNDDEGMLIRSYAHESGGGGSSSQIYSSTASHVQRPVSYTSVDPVRRARVVRKERVSRNTNIQLELPRENNESDSDASPLGADDNPFLARRVLSPVGPWMMVESRPENDGWEPLSSSCGSLSPLSSARAPDADDFAELSPRSRLLWFSAWADTEPSLATAVGMRHMERSASHSGAFRPLSASARQQLRVGGTKPIAGCASVKPASSSRQQSTGRGGGAIESSDALKHRAVALTKKRPQSSGGSKVRKSVVV